MNFETFHWILQHYQTAQPKLDTKTKRANLLKTLLLGGQFNLATNLYV
jgi:hypothetical protein